jgi:uncharacterized protein YdhG (YjbR/CyaY superfamily)
MRAPSDIDSYIRNEPAPIQKKLRTVRSLIRKAAPKATEKIAWGMPTLYLEGNLIHFAAFKGHLSLFPGTAAILHFKKDLIRYKTSKGTIQIPYDLPIPAALVIQITKYCVKRNLAAVEAKKKAKAARRKER